MATVILQTKSADATVTNQAKSGAAGIGGGTPIGLLLALTYAAPPDLTWTTLSKSSSTFTLVTKN